MVDIPQFVILRDDTYQEGTDARHRIAVKGLVYSQDQAAKEVERLNLLNGKLGCVYWWSWARLLRPSRQEEE
jgi:hypothetical protein